MTKQPWPKSPPELVDRFTATVADVGGLDVRPMFGFPAGFVNGNLATSLHRSSWIVRLPEAQRAACLADGWTTFEPMTGRPMREYLLLPEEVAGDARSARPWVERAAAYTASLPPKPGRSRPPRRSR